MVVHGSESGSDNDVFAPRTPVRASAHAADAITETPTAARSPPPAVHVFGTDRHVDFFDPQLFDVYQPDFDVVTHGGMSSRLGAGAAHRDTLVVKAMSVRAKLFCRVYRIPIRYTFNLAVYGEAHGAMLADAMLDKLEYLLTVALTHRHGAPFTAHDLQHWQPSSSLRNLMTAGRGSRRTLGRAWNIYEFHPGT